MAEAESTMSGRRWRVAAAAMLAAVVGTGALATAPASADPSVRVSLGDATGLEHTDTQASLFIPLTLSRATTSPVIVSYWTESGTATAGTDFVKWGTPNAPRSATIAAGARQTTINVPVKPDGETENNETFTVVLGSVALGNATIFQGSGQGTIVDSAVGFNVSDVAIVEGDEPGLKAQIRIEFATPVATRSGIPHQTNNDSAVAPTDYRAITPEKDRRYPFDLRPPVLWFEPGQSSKTVDIPINGNETQENNRGFYLNHSYGRNYVTIIDDDVAPVSTTTTTVASGLPEVFSISSAVSDRPGFGMRVLGGTGFDTVQAVTLKGEALPFSVQSPTQMSVYYPTSLPADVYSVRLVTASSFTTFGLCACG